MGVYSGTQNIIVPTFLGRLGNNLFQVAACIGYSKDYGIPWAILPHYHHKPVYNYFKFPIWKGNPRTLKTYDTATDQGFVYVKIPKFEVPGVNIRGFWQSWKYFDHAKEEVLKAWAFRYYPGYADFASVHVRRTDYLQYADNFGAITPEYLNEAISMARNAGYQKFVVFSDDLLWCREAFKEFAKWDVSFEYSEHQNEFEDLSKMSSCSFNIIANSSFSWIAAYANPNPNKVVVTPHETSWFGPKAKLNTKDLLPPDWVKIKFR
jgi:hypothetical protein